MKERSENQSMNLNKVNNIEEKDPFTKSFELTGEELEEELHKLNYVMSICKEMKRKQMSNENDDYIIY